MAAIPTVYDGVLFRSRLEAKWAAWFDLNGLGWAYEPIDLPRYIPDFIVNGSLLAEAKPALHVRDLYGHTAKIESSGWAGNAILLGGTTEVIGFRYQGHWSMMASSLWFLFPCVCRRRHGDRLGCIKETTPIALDYIVARWRATWTEAGNIVQWRSPR